MVLGLLFTFSKSIADINYICSPEIAPDETIVYEIDRRKVYIDGNLVKSNKLKTSSSYVKFDYQDELIKNWTSKNPNWYSKSCIGNYLNSLEQMKIKADNMEDSDYSGYFWFNKKNKSRHAEMRGHGGQRIYIDIEKGSVLAYHSITKDYDNKSIWGLLKQ